MRRRGAGHSQQGTSGARRRPTASAEDAAAVSSAAEPANSPPHHGVMRSLRHISHSEINCQSHGNWCPPAGGCHCHCHSHWVLKGFCLPELQGLQDSSRAASALPFEEDDGDEAFRLVEVVANRVAAVAAALAADSALRMALLQVLQPLPCELGHINQPALPVYSQGDDSILIATAIVLGSIACLSLINNNMVVT